MQGASRMVRKILEFALEEEARGCNELEAKI